MNGRVAKAQKGVCEITAALQSISSVARHFTCGMFLSPFTLMKQSGTVISLKLDVTSSELRVKWWHTLPQPRVGVKHLALRFQTESKAREWLELMQNESNPYRWPRDQGNLAKKRSSFAEFGRNSKIPENISEDANGVDQWFLVTRHDTIWKMILAGNEALLDFYCQS